jgi:ferredoxin
MDGLTQRLVYLPGVVTLALDADKCDGCGACTFVCPHRILVLEQGKARITDRDRCMECGACARNCESGALTVDAGVGCAAAIINGALGRDESDCCA